MERFFRSWGGEALYNFHENHEITGPALNIPGTPSIVTAAVPVNDINSFMDIGERLVNVWCASNDIRTGHGAEFEGYVERCITAEEVIDIS